LVVCCLGDDDSAEDFSSDASVKRVSCLQLLLRLAVVGNR